jgi:acetyltransferase (GNAT) family protein
MNSRVPHPSSHKSAYVVVPATSIAEDDLLAFAATLGPHSPSSDQILSSWWRRAEPNCAVAMVHEETRAMVGLCGGRPCEWMIGGQPVSTVAICDWYVAPKHAGKLIGKRMVQHFQRPDRMLYAISISDVAIAYLQRLGWVGPYVSCLMVALLPRLGRVAWSFLRRPGDLDFSDHSIRGGEPLGSLGVDLDRVESSRARSPPDHMRRGSKEWSWRLSVCGERSYHFAVAHRSGEPVGYAAVRGMASGRVPQLGNRRAAMITDLVAADDDPKLLRALARRALAMAGELQAVAALTTTTNPAHRRALAAAGFMSPAFPLIGRALKRRSPVFMWLPKGPGCELKSDHMELTFADAAVDLDL